MEAAYTANLIKVRSKERGIAVTLMLSECGIYKSLIYDMEKRNKIPSAEVLEKIANYLDCSVDYLIGRTDNPEVNK